MEIGSHLKMETDPVSETVFSSHLEFWMMRGIHKPSDYIMGLVCILLMWLMLFHLIADFAQMNVYSQQIVVHLRSCSRPACQWHPSNPLRRLSPEHAADVWGPLPRMVATRVT
jgi:hypothetical protein